MTNEELKQKCLEYDFIEGSCPECAYNGMNIYHFITSEKEYDFGVAIKDWDSCLKNFIPGITIEINGCQLKRTCAACPEQYDVFKDGKQVGYLRLRHGKFTVETPKCDGEIVYRAEPLGYGSFHKDERIVYLKEAIKAIDKSLNPE